MKINAVCTSSSLSINDCTSIFFLPISDHHSIESSFFEQSLTYSCLQNGLLIESLSTTGLCAHVYFILSTQKLMSLSFAPMVTQISSDTIILHTKSSYQNGGQTGGQPPTLFPGPLLFLLPLAPGGRKMRDPGNKVGQPLGRIMFPWQSLQNKNEPPGIQKLITPPSSGSMEGRVGKQKPCMASKWPVHYLQ